jgi:hypothetical protein
VSAPEDQPRHDLTVVEMKLGRDDEPDILGCLLAAHTADGWTMTAYVRPGLEVDEFAGVHEGALERLQRLRMHGPEPDGWLVRPDGDLQLWLRLVYLPDLEG